MSRKNYSAVVMAWGVVLAIALPSVRPALAQANESGVAPELHVPAAVPDPVFHLAVGAKPAGGSGDQDVMKQVLLISSREKRRDLSQRQFAGALAIAFGVAKLIGGIASIASVAEYQNNTLASAARGGMSNTGFIINGIGEVVEIAALVFGGMAVLPNSDDWHELDEIEKTVRAR